MNMTQNEIAEVLEVTQPMVSRLLTGRRAVTWKMAKKLSENFGRSPAWWMTANTDRIRRVLRSGKIDGSKENGGQNGERRAA
jgi:transcriptional regulator with XRE-family HTH domain